MEIRTFYWQDHILTKPEFLFRKLLGRLRNSDFRYGNAGDIYGKVLLEEHYKRKTVNIKNGGNRFLAVGSIAHRAMSGDILCGVGVKSKKQLPEELGQITIYGLRGPLSYEAFKVAGADMSNVKFLYDPGLLIKFLIPDLDCEAVNVSFIPHYRERNRFRIGLPKGIRMIDIDDSPINVANKIRSSKLLYSSSLHGIIFAHSLGVPCIYVRPQTNETEFKFIDYYESVNLKYKRPLSSIFEADFRRDSDTPADIDVKFADFFFPSEKVLIDRGILK